MKKNKIFILVVVISFSIAVALGLYTKIQMETPIRKLVVNQIGYPTNSPKIAFLINSSFFWQNKIELVDSKSKETVFEADVGARYTDASTKDSIQTIDFTAFNQEGNYYFKYGNLQSHPFQIGKDIYQDALTKLLRSYYLQRCGVAVQDSISGISHPPCHIKDGLIARKDSLNQAGKLKSAQGGWHDAGDYGKYVASTAVTIGRLLNLYEQYPQLFSESPRDSSTSRQLNIPESGNGKPDLLDEVKVGLDWMLTMQREDGAVYRKLSGKNWPGTILPHEDNQQRFIYGISTPETAKFAAAMAMAGRVYTSYDAQLAQTYLKAAQNAWNFLQKEQSMKVDWVEGDDSGSGKYLFSKGDYDPAGALQTDKDDRLWAAAELFISTGDSSFEQYLAQTISSFSYTLFEWADPSSLGMADYLMQTRRKGSDNLKQQIKEKLIKRADTLIQKVSSSGYHLANDVFIWGSNKRAAEEGITLFYAYRVTSNQAYLKAAIEQLDYLLGRNHFNQSFITSVGTNSVRHVHHRIAQAKKIVIPGLMVNGPNAQAQDKIAPKDQGPLSYVDDQRSYATNEYAIDYNASVIGLMGMLMGSMDN